jgi:hypothetical protein
VPLRQSPLPFWGCSLRRRGPSPPSHYSHLRAHAPVAETCWPLAFRKARPPPLVPQYSGRLGGSFSLPPPVASSGPAGSTITDDGCLVLEPARPRSARARPARARHGADTGGLEGVQLSSAARHVTRSGARNAAQGEASPRSSSAEELLAEELLGDESLGRITPTTNAGDCPSAHRGHRPSTISVHSTGADSVPVPPDAPTEALPLLPPANLPRFLRGAALSCRAAQASLHAGASLSASASAPRRGATRSGGSAPISSAKRAQSAPPPLLSATKGDRASAQDSPALCGRQPGIGARLAPHAMAAGAAPP